MAGAGPSGLARAVCAASEGLPVLVLEHHAFGGQAGASARIENYLGFPTGISGRALAGRAFVLSQKFGAQVKARAVVLACGARYRKPELANLAAYAGSGVYYRASPIEAKLCANEEVVLVGGGNSAGQAAVYLSGRASKVHMLIRGPGLAASMPSYLIERIAATKNITLHTACALSALEGDGECLSSVTWPCKDAAR